MRGGTLRARICAPALRFLRAQQKHQGKHVDTEDTIRKKMFPTDRLCIRVSVYLLKKSQPNGMCQNVKTCAKSKEHGDFAHQFTFGASGDEFLL